MTEIYPQNLNLTHPETGRQEPQSARSSFLVNLKTWEIVALALSFILIAFVAIPNYFGYLDTVRGKESSNRLTLLANCLKYLAIQNQTKPGEKICELFDLNEVLELAQRKIYERSEISSEDALFFKVGAEPDCPGGGDFIYEPSMFLGPDGNIIEPLNTKVLGPKGEYYRSKGLYVADMSKVDGNIGI